MKHLIFAPSERYPVAVLVKSAAFAAQPLRTSYIAPLIERGIPAEDLIAFTLKYDDNGKAPVKFIKEYLDKLLPALDTVGAKTLLCTDSAYFKVLTKSPKAEVHHGYVLPCKIAGYEHLSVILGINHQALIYNPEVQGKLDLSLGTLASHVQGTYQALGIGIIHSAQYPEGVQAIAEALESLHQYPRLTCDIEAFSLRFNEAGIGTCAFAWDQHNGIAFACDYAQVVREDGSMDKESPEESWASHYGYQRPNKAVRQLLFKFFSTYPGEITWHNAAYDVKVIIYTLWMASLSDQKGLLTGLDIMTRSIQDTKLIAYLATNTTAGNVLGLKPLAHEFAGNWAKDDIKDIRLIPKAELLRYNLVDCLSTWYVREKYEPIMQADQQEELYYSLFLPSLKLILQMELTGMPMNKARIAEIRAELEGMRDGYLQVIQGSNLIKAMNLLVQTKAMEAANAKLKTKQHPLEKFADIAFNPNSGPQLQVLLYELMGLPVIDLTDTKQPATGAETIEKLIHHTQEASYKELLAALIGHGQVVKILNTFIPAFERGIEKAQDGILWLHGSFNLGGTVSGRLSSSDPNMQNIPANSIFGKLIKSLFMAGKGWLFCGADFNSLEDYISALTTKDPNKLLVYEQGFDGHCLRAYAYFKDQCPDIRQAEEPDRCFKININGRAFMCKSGDFIVTSTGARIPVENYFDTHQRL